MKRNIPLALATLIAVGTWLPLAPMSALGAPPLWPPSKKIMRQESSPTWLAYSPNGQILATAGLDGAVRLWDTASGKLTRTIKAHAGPVWGLAFAPDGRSVFTGGADARAAQWDAGSGRNLRNFGGYNEEALYVAASSDGRLLFTGSGQHDEVIKVFDIASGKALPDITGHSGAVQCLGFTSDGRLFVSGGNDGTLRVFDSANRKQLRSMTLGHSVFHLAISPDGDTVAAVDTSGSLTFWNLNTGAAGSAIPAHNGVIFAVSYAPNGKWLATAGADKAIRLWDAETATELITLSPMADQVWGLSFSPDGSALAAATRDGTVRLIDMQAIMDSLGVTL